MNGGKEIGGREREREIRVRRRRQSGERETRKVRVKKGRNDLENQLKEGVGVRKKGGNEKKGGQ